MKKSMKDRRMDMSRGNPDSSDFFPPEPERRILRRCDDIGGDRYPDTEEAIYEDQMMSIRDARAGKARDDLRH